MAYRLALAFSVMAFLISLFLPAVAMVHAATGEVDEIDQGFQLLAFGWVGLLIGSVAWFANPIYGLGVMLLLFKQTIVARWVLVIAWLIGMSALRQMMVPFVGDDGGFRRLLLQPLAGFYFWAASLTIGVLAAFIQPRGKSSSRVIAEPQYRSNRDTD